MSEIFCYHAFANIRRVQCKLNRLHQRVVKKRVDRMLTGASQAKSTLCIAAAFCYRAIIGITVPKHLNEESFRISFLSPLCKSRLLSYIHIPFCDPSKPSSCNELVVYSRNSAQVLCVVGLFHAFGPTVVILCYIFHLHCIRVYRSKQRIRFSSFGFSLCYQEMAKNLPSYRVPKHGKSTA